MRIAVNTRLLLKDKLEGIGWFSYESLKRIVEGHPEHEFLFIFDRPFSEEFVFADNVKPILAGLPTRHPVLWYLWFEKVIPSILKKNKVDLFLSPDGYLSLSTDTPSINVIHDINFEHRAQDLPYFTGKYYRKYFRQFAHKADRVATVSEYSKNDIVETYGLSPDKIDVVYNGCNINYTPISESDQFKAKLRFAQSKDFFLFIGSLHPRKNIENLLKAFEIFKTGDDQEMKLLIVGEVMFKAGSIYDFYNKMQYKKDVVFTGRLSPEKLHLLLGSATALSFVPYFEGFGIPVLEAMYCDTPVITSNVTSLPEVAGDAALYADPYSPESIANLMTALANDQELRMQLIEKGRIQREKFSWDQTANKLWNCIDKVLHV